MMIKNNYSNHLDLHPRTPCSDPLPLAWCPTWDRGARTPPVTTAKALPRRKRFKIHLFICMKPPPPPGDLPLSFTPALPRGDAPDSALGLQEEQQLLTPAPPAEQGKTRFTLQMLCKRAELFGLPEEKRKKNPQTHNQLSLNALPKTAESFLVQHKPRVV